MLPEAKWPTEDLGIVREGLRRVEMFGGKCYQTPEPVIARPPKPKPAKLEPVLVPITLRPRNSGNWRRLTDDGVQERIKAILRATATAFEVGVGEMMDPSRTRRLAYPRFAAMVLMRKLTRLSLPSIGRVLHRDHTTCLAGIRKAIKLRNTDVVFRRRSIAIVTALRVQPGTRQ